LPLAFGKLKDPHFDHHKGFSTPEKGNFQNHSQSGIPSCSQLNQSNKEIKYELIDATKIPAGIQAQKRP
jgi:hypothetical protein